MWQAALSAFLVLTLVNGGLAQKAATTNTSRNERVKRAEDPDFPIPIDDTYRDVAGMWVPESKDPTKTLIFPEQVKISCTHSDLTCSELTVPLESSGGLVFIGGIEEKTWQVVSWDKNGLLASYDADPSPTAALSEKCHRHVLSMSFASGGVSTSDIPTHEKGCEMFPETDTYKLVRGQYYVDTTPGNDRGNKPNGDKPTKGAPQAQNPDQRLLSDADYKALLLRTETELPNWEGALTNISPEKDSQIPYALGKLIVDQRKIGLMEIGNVRIYVANLRAKRTVSGELALHGFLESLFDVMNEVEALENTVGVTHSIFEKYAPELGSLYAQIGNDLQVRVDLLEKGTCP